MHVFYAVIFFVCTLNNIFLAAQSALTQAISNKYCNNRADYVIVGVGTAGALLANQLSGDLTTSVIALHRGENLTDDPLIKYSRNAALTVGALPLQTGLYINGFTTPQINADNRELLWGLALPEGGASSVNGMAWSRETNFINTAWEAIAGPQWSVQILTNLYKQLEQYYGQTTDPAARGFSGPLTIRQVAQSQLSQVSQKFTQAIINATGFPFVLDYNDPNTPIGASTQLQYTQSIPDGSLRMSSAATFLNSSVITPAGLGVNGRKLQVFFDATALRTIWSGTTAVGVEYIQNGITKQVFAQKGVIVCAGLFSSPFLLHSGIGASSLLNSLNIPVIYNNPSVGQGLADQPSLLMVFSTNPDDTSVPPLDPNSLFTQIAYLPDPTGDQTIRRLRIASTNPVPGVLIVLMDVLQPVSRGSVSINSSDPLASPVIDEGLFTNSPDLDLLQRGMQIYIKNINTALQAIDLDYELIVPNPNILTDDVAVINYIKENTNALQHFQSHCRMAPLNQGGVVDSTGRVYGVQNLFVADDSIIPLCMDGSPLASAYLMAANIARQILSQ